MSCGGTATLAEDVRSTRFAALFLIGSSEPHDKILSLRLPVPLLSHGALHYVTYAPDLTIWDDVADALARAGAKRPAFATNLRPEVAALAFAFPEDPAIRDDRAIGQAAFAAVRRLLAATPRPDALVVHPDNLVPGAVAAVMETWIVEKSNGSTRKEFLSGVGSRPMSVFPKSSSKRSLSATS